MPIRPHKVNTPESMPASCAGHPRIMFFFWHLLVLLVIGVWNAPLAVAASAGAITHFSGSASIVTSDGQTRSVGKGARLNEGDKIVTGDDGQVEIRFSDKSVVRLQPRSKFRVDEYSYQGKDSGSQARSIFTLLKGGLNTVSGIIGKINRSGYAIHTSAATIGIRGTEYSALLKNGLHVSVQRGEISLTNGAGSFAVSAGQSAYVANKDSSPRYDRNSQNNPAPGKNGNSSNGTTQINGNMRIDATTKNTNAVASGQGNTATNQAGVIGGK